MKQLTKMLGDNILSATTEIANKFSDFQSGKIKVKKDDNKKVIGYTFEFSFSQADKDGNIISRKGFVENNNSRENWYVFDIKNGKTTDKKRLIYTATSDAILDVNSAKHATKPNDVGTLATLATNLGVAPNDIAKLDVTNIVAAKTAEQATAAFMLALSNLDNFATYAAKCNELAAAAEKATRTAKAIDNGFKITCNGAGLSYDDVIATAQRYNITKELAFSAHMLAKATNQSVAECVNNFTPATAK